jgi:tripartite-type tricarboxylate transporter receptor subunit TctC
MRTLAAIAALSAVLLAPPLAAQTDLSKMKLKDFPTQPVEYTVVYPAGGGMDVTARLLAKYVEKVSGDRIVVNNRTGGAGMVGHSYLATQAKPDGYAVGIVANLMWGNAMLRAQGKWAYTDLEPIGYLNSDALTWVGPADGPLKGKSIKDLVQLAKDEPGTLRIATVPGSMWEYLVEQLETAAGAKFLRVPLQEGGAGINALVGGNVDVAQGFFAEFAGIWKPTSLRRSRSPRTIACRI